MKKINVLWTILYLIFLGVFNLVFYMLGGTDHSGAVWTSYIFIHVAYVLLVATLYSISAVYFLVEFVVGVIFILTKTQNLKLTLIVQILIAAVYVVMLISNMIANEYTADSMERQAQEVKYVKESAAMILSMMDQVDDKVAAKKVEKVYDLIKSSPSKSNARVADIEYAVYEEIEAMQAAVEKRDNAAISSSADKLYRLGQERNRQLKLVR